MTSGGRSRPDAESSALGVMDLRCLVVAIDAADLDAVSGFWAGIGVQLAPDHVRPEWPDGDQQQQLHLDLWVTDLAAAHEAVMGLGATLLEDAADPEVDDGWQVYADPAGHPFCLCWHRTALG